MFFYKHSPPIVRHSTILNERNLQQLRVCFYIKYHYKIKPMTNFKKKKKILILKIYKVKN